jgi:hypothetical protein
VSSALVERGGFGLSINSSAALKEAWLTLLFLLLPAIVVFRYLVTALNQYHMSAEAQNPPGNSESK